MFAMPYFIFALRVFLGGYFLFAAIPKIAEPLVFSTAISHYHILPSFAVNAFALTVPWLEVLVGVCLILGFKVRVASALYFALVAMFTVAVIIAIVNGLKIDCGCFGDQGGEEVGWAKVFKNCLLLGGCVVLWIYPSSVLALDSFNGRSNHGV